MGKKTLKSESMPEFDEGIKNMNEYDKGRIDGKIQLIKSEDSIYQAMDTFCQESLSPDDYSKWLSVLRRLSLSRIKAYEFCKRNMYCEWIKLIDNKPIKKGFYFIKGLNNNGDNVKPYSNLIWFTGERWIIREGCEVTEWLDEKQ